MRCVPLLLQIYTHLKFAEKSFNIFVPILIYFCYCGNVFKLSTKIVEVLKNYVFITPNDEGIFFNKKKTNLVLVIRITNLVLKVSSIGETFHSFSTYGKFY